MELTRQQVWALASAGYEINEELSESLQAHRDLFELIQFAHENGLAKYPTHPEALFMHPQTLGGACVFASPDENGVFEDYSIRFNRLVVLTRAARPRAGRNEVWTGTAATYPQLMEELRHQQYQWIHEVSALCVNLPGLPIDPSFSVGSPVDVVVQGLWSRRDGK